MGGTLWSSARAAGVPGRPSTNESSRRVTRGTCRDPIQRSGRLTVGLLAVVSLWTGCTTAQVQKVPDAPMRVAPREAIAIFTWTESSLERDAVVCISEAVLAAHPKVRIITPDEFRQTVFSYQLPREEAQRTRYFTLLMSEPAIAERMASLGIRYLVSIGGRTEESETRGGILCGGGTGGGGCLGAVFWDQRTNLAASIYDFRERRATEELQVTNTGRGWFAMVMILPVGLPSFAESRACRGLGEAVANYLLGKSTPGSSGPPEPRDR